MKLTTQDMMTLIPVAASESSAVFSPCRRYRYELWRRWTEGPFVQFVGLNPSTADETNDDPTIRRCIAFAKSWGYGALCMTNLFAWRATDPADMKQQIEPVGAENDATLLRIGSQAGIIVAAWGSHGSHQGRDGQVKGLLKPLEKLHFLSLTKSGAPGHPLYLPKTLVPVKFK